jgi:phosphoribosylformylglycinamidine cyclo-ligase
MRLIFKGFSSFIVPLAGYFFTTEARNRENTYTKFKIQEIHMKESFTYADAGVDIDKANKLVDAIGEIAKQTARAGVMSDIGGFGGLFSLNLANVAMCVNDIIVQGAKPLFFLDYLSMGKLDNQRATDIITGIAQGCKQARCALLGGETAEMPGFYAHNEYDLAGFTVGVVDNSKIIDGTGIRVGHKLIGIASSGLHSNGYSLVRKVCFEVLNLKIDQHVTELGKTIGEELLTPTKIYAATISGLLKDLPIHGIAHITGGGISGNIVRIVPQACSILIREESWDVPPIFSFLQQAGNIPAKEMARTFNMGIGMILIVPDYAVLDVTQRIEAMNERAFVVGEILDCKEAGRRLVWE